MPERAAIGGLLHAHSCSHPFCALLAPKYLYCLQADPALVTGRWRVLLDAAKGCVSCPPDLSRHPADFVALSYYKLFGYPTGGTVPFSA